MRAERFSYSHGEAVQDVNGGLPFVPITLTYRDQTVQVSALVDSGSTVNVLPYDVGVQLGLIWEEQDFSLDVVGVLRGAPAYGILLIGEIEPFSPVRLAFVWTRKTSEEVRVILGQVNFFQEFKVSFDGKVQTFDLLPNR
jgi:hypothetical protein